MSFYDDEARQARADYIERRAERIADFADPREFGSRQQLEAAAHEVARRQADTNGLHGKPVPFRE